ncbi:hypothetical protein BDV25DRAFT_136741 [Aspergillus avenaceus]|uniref:Uncharacterized protein n=1 Tax=Aspergillus avenaceus TaxID=36643 RepID=A0A5N6U4X4_ASPAV|nr:hypothetical protein BDV25DRAFT_136741 [Aspergillus avenaceus]
MNQCDEIYAIASQIDNLVQRSRARLSTSDLAKDISRRLDRFEEVERRMCDFKQLFEHQMSQLEWSIMVEIDRLKEDVGSLSKSVGGSSDTISSLQKGIGAPNGRSRRNARAIEGTNPRNIGRVGEISQPRDRSRSFPIDPSKFSFIKGSENGRNFYYKGCKISDDSEVVVFVNTKKKRDILDVYVNKSHFMELQGKTPIRVMPMQNIMSDEDLRNFLNGANTAWSEYSRKDNT